MYTNDYCIKYNGLSSCNSDWLLKYMHNEKTGTNYYNYSSKTTI